MKGNKLISTENAAAFERSLDMLDRSIKEFRNISYEMIPEELLHSGLDAALTALCAEISNQNNVRVTYQPAEMQHERITQQVSVGIYWLLKELISMRVKQGKSKNILVESGLTENNLRITLTDDGDEFELIPDITRRSGWDKIMDTVALISGKYRIESTAGNGTIAEIEIPAK